MSRETCESVDVEEAEEVEEEEDDDDEIEETVVDDVDDDEEGIDENGTVERSEDEGEVLISLSHISDCTTTDGCDEGEHNQTEERKRTSSDVSSLPFRRCLL
jgi:hypothetical protein